MLNNINLMGRLTKDPECRTTPNGVSVATWYLAVDRDYKGRHTADGLLQLHRMERNGRSGPAVPQKRQADYRHRKDGNAGLSGQERKPAQSV